MIIDRPNAGDVLGQNERRLPFLLRHVAAPEGDHPVGTVLAAFLNRESLGSTGIGHGIAVPHALLEELLAPTATLAVMDRPVWFRAPDEQAVDVVLAVIWPRERAGEFMPALARFCRKLSRLDVLKGIRCAASPDGVLACLGASDGLGHQPHPATLVSSARTAGGATREGIQ
ncbi:PTS sugar transporter subunit IIA [Mesorhizobium sp. B2-4-19]|uniref:PTS sugar transporter subunit IIA n=1 Tax=Mesorhizobium sp. B2-4-19 TaxID=2589930 RepID=UPI001125BFDA|nr:PTS sugar transporter subunit IIA [Mesorhizobium sp. B2-4-19]TPK54871.1 PTS sugar transporter subunit IIA [Mesorhizobium sp. B2-4-19]